MRNDTMFQVSGCSALVRTPDGHVLRGVSRQLSRTHTVRAILQDDGIHAVELRHSPAFGDVAGFAYQHADYRPNELRFRQKRGLAVQQGSIFYAGRVYDHVGAFAQWSYDGIGHHSALDNTDIRAAGHFTAADVDFIYGITMNNNPTVSDVWNSTPAFGFPYASSSVGVSPLASTLIDGSLAQQVVGAAAYAFWQRSIYVEFGAYRTADQIFSLFRAGRTPHRLVAWRD
ncbi:hypothetical protein [Pandoraea sp. XY-2]|uniref:hypothetical protein n=1 Tax=Pandoraea sp. XY-2 TaxID=2518599 RepID=UPI001F0FB997|nr:hypothetical protein [Pandoraea sp. XY-2]